MFRFDTPAALQLSRRDLISGCPARTVRLQVQSGRLWVTRANDLDDHFLGAGDSLLLPSGALVLIGAEDASLLRFEPVESGSRRWLQRIAQWLRSPQHRLPNRRPMRRRGAATVVG